MDSTPTSHRTRRGRKAIEKCSSTPIRTALKEPCTSRTSPTISPMGTSSVSWLTPSTDRSDADRNEQLTRSALRRELNLDEEDDYIMPYTQIQNPGANGEVFWNYNASPATARAKAALKERMSQIEDKSRNEERFASSAPSPILTIPMLPLRRKLPSKSKEDNHVKEQQNQKEVDAMLKSMKDIFQAELQKHHNPTVDVENSTSVEVLQEKNISFGKDGLISDDDSFVLRATQVVGNIECEEKCNLKKERDNPKGNIAKTDNEKTKNSEAFDDDDDFDFLLSQMEMPNSNPTNTLTNKNAAAPNPGNLIRQSKDSNGYLKRTILMDSSVNSESVLTSESSKLLNKQTYAKDEKIDNTRSETKMMKSSESDSYFKRFKSASGPPTQLQSTIVSDNKEKKSSFGRRSYSTPDASLSHDQLPGGRHTLVDLSKLHKTDHKSKCTREEIELKRLEAIKKREIERKRQEAIKRRQLNSQKTLN